MPMIHTCAAPGCGTLTLGEYCIEHERQEPAGPESRSGRALHAFRAAFPVAAAAVMGALLGARLPHGVR